MSNPSETFSKTKHFYLFMWNVKSEMCKFIIGTTTDLIQVKFMMIIQL